MGQSVNPVLILLYLPKILSRLHVTLGIVVIATLIGIILGTALASIRLLRIPLLNPLAMLFISFTRGTPVLIQLFIVFYGLPLLLQKIMTMDTRSWDKLYFVVIAYGFNTSAFFAEILRASIASIPIGQWEAAYSVGLVGRQVFFRIIGPQAIRVAMPNLSVSIMGLLQNTALAFSLGIIDVMGKVRAIGANTYHTFEGYVSAAMIFVTLNFMLEAIFRKLGRILDKKRTAEVQW
jgi:L-cystine transport system permease protein